MYRTIPKMEEWKNRTEGLSAGGVYENAKDELNVVSTGD